MGEQSKCQCPHCGTKIRYELALSGSTATCPACQDEFNLPNLPPRPTPAAGSDGSNYPAGPQLLPSARGGLGLAFADPMDSQPGAMEGMGKEGTLTWGFLLCLAFPFVSWLAFWRGANMLDAVLGSTRGVSKAKFLDHVEAIVSMTVLVGILFGVLLVFNVMRGQKVPARCILFSTGLVLVPLTGLSLYGFVLSWGAKAIGSADALEVIGYLTSFFMLLSVSSAFLLLFATLTSVIGYTRKLGFWLVPGVLMVTFLLFSWASKLTNEIGNLGN